MLKAVYACAVFNLLAYSLSAPSHRQQSFWHAILSSSRVRSRWLILERGDRIGYVQPILGYPLAELPSSSELPIAERTNSRVWITSTEFCPVCRVSEDRFAPERYADPQVVSAAPAPSDPYPCTHLSPL